MIMHKTPFDDIIEKAREYQKFFSNSIRSRIFGRVRHCLSHFDRTVDRFRGLIVLIVPIRNYEPENLLPMVRQRGEFSSIFLENVDEMEGAFHMIKIVSSAGSVHSKKLIFMTDDVAKKWINQMIFCFVYDNVLNREAYERIESAFESAGKHKKFVDRRQKDGRKSFFSYGGSLYLGEGWMTNTRGKIERKHPNLFLVIEGVLRGDRKFLR